jgi:cell growth-regulating nucleolar protein
MSEDQKYQGHLYREKPAKQPNSQKRKSVSIVEPSDANALIHSTHHAYVEDAHDIDSGTPEIPPHVPSPPPAIPDEPVHNVNVFDFLVTEKSPSTSKQVVSAKKGRNSEEQLHSDQYDADGYMYGAEPVPPGMRNVNDSFISLDFMTPAAKVTKAKLDRDRSAGMQSISHSRKNSGTGSISEKKRKRAQTETYEADTLMQDAPQTAMRPQERGIAHSGLTGGLGRMMSHDDAPTYVEDQEYSQKDKRKSRQTSQYEDPASPLKKSRRSRDLSEPQSRDGSGSANGNGLGITIKGRASKVLSMVGTGSVLAALANPAAAHNQGTSQALVKKTRRASDESRDRDGRNGSQVRGEKKRHKVHRHNGTARGNVRFESGSRSRRPDDRSRSPEASRRKIKAIEYHSDKQRRDDSDSDDSAYDEKGQMVVFGSAQKTIVRCETFLQFVTKGPDSEKGCSMNKALKRWHRDAGLRRTEEKADEEKNLWKGLRLKRNERGEIVVFF